MRYYLKARSFLLSYIYVQLFITLWSLPILLAWGIPFCPLSFIGNLIFSPLLIGFLVLSSLIFFTQLCYIPNGALIGCLEYLCSGWRYLLHSVSATWSWSCVQPPLILLLIMPLPTIAICSAKKLKGRLQKTICLFIPLIVIAIALPAWYNPTTIIEKIDSPYGPITLIYTNKTLVIIDPGSLGKRISSSSWVQYTLIPTIAQKTGKTSIDHFITLRPTCITFQILADLSQKSLIHKLYLPLWRDKLPYNAFKQFKIIQKNLNKDLIRIGSHTFSLKLGPQSYLTIAPTDQLQKLNGYSIAEIAITGSIDNHAVTIYASKTKCTQ